MRNAWVIARREYNQYFSTTVSYAVALTILFVVGAIFFLVFNQGIQSALSGEGSPAPDIKIVAEWLVIMLILTVPALTMRLISDENRMGTLELLLTAPLQDWELIVGKWLGGLLFLLTVLAVTLIYPIILNIYETPGTNLQWPVLSLFILIIALVAMFWNLVTGKRREALFILLAIWVVAIVGGILLYRFTVPGIDWGLTMSNYLGLFLICAAFLAIGVGISALFSNQIAAFIVTILAFVFLWWIISFVAQFAQGTASDIFTYLAMGGHFNNNLIAGTINLSDVVYYLSLTALGLFGGTVAVEISEVELMAKKQNKVERYAFIGLIVAGIALIATVLLGLAEGLVALKFASPLNININLWISISAALIVLGLAAYAIMAPDKVARFFTGRQARYGSNALIMSLAFLGILFVVNMLTFQNPKVLADMTEDKQNTLAPQTIQALTNLPGKVNAIAFFSNQTPSDTARQLLAKYKSASNGKFDYSFVDPNSNPTLAKQYGITGDGKLALVMGKSSQVAASADETTIDQALILLISPQTRVVYFLTGHGEADINGSDNTAMTQAKSMLQNKSYTVDTVNLATTNSVPSDAKAIVIAGPKNPLLDQEVALLKAYVAKGGSLGGYGKPDARHQLRLQP